MFENKNLYIKNKLKYYDMIKNIVLLILTILIIIFVKEMGL